MATHPVIDLHEDISMYFISHGGGEPLGDFGLDLPGRTADIPKYLKGNVRLVFASIFPGLETFDVTKSRHYEKIYGKWLPGIRLRAPQLVAFEQISIYYRLAESYPELVIVDTLGGVKRILASANKIGLLLHMEGAEPIEDPYDLVLWKRLGLRSLGLTWNYNNKYAASCISKKDYGLTPEGEELVRMANKLKIIIDLAHASLQTAIDTINASRKPVVISHANYRGIVDSPRNVPDEVLEALEKNRFVISLTAISSLVSRKKEPTIDDLVEHYTVLRDTYGYEILAIGTDFLGLLGIPSPKGLESIDKIQLLLNKLEEKGFTDTEVEAVAYGNALRVLIENFS